MKKYKPIAATLITTSCLKTTAVSVIDLKISGL